MKILKTTLLTLVLLSTATAQAPAGSTNAPGIDVIKTTWVAVGVGRDEAEAANLRGDPVGNRVGIEPTSFRVPVHQADVSVELKNVGQKTIKAISLELVFLDAITKKEILRYRLSHKNDVGAGDTVILRKRVNESEKGYYYVPGTNKKQLIPRAAAATRQAVVTRVVYTDGAVWQP